MWIFVTLLLNVPGANFGNKNFLGAPENWQQIFSFPECIRASCTSLCIPAIRAQGCLEGGVGTLSLLKWPGKEISATCVAELSEEAIQCPYFWYGEAMGAIKHIPMLKLQRRFENHLYFYILVRVTYNFEVMKTAPYYSVVTSVPNSILYIFSCPAILHITYQQWNDVGNSKAFAVKMCAASIHY